MANTLYLDCSCGISGDMLVAALLDLGADREALREALDSIPAGGFAYDVTRVKKAGVDCCSFNVYLDAEHENHDHDMEYLHGSGHSHEHGHDHEHEHSHEPGHAHEHEHGHGKPQGRCPHRSGSGGCGHKHIDLYGIGVTAHSHHHEGLQEAHGHHHHEHRGLKEITEIIGRVRMSENARALALKIFDIIGEAEARAHAVPKDEVHFHEVGAIDSIVDIVAIAVCADSLQLGEVIVPRLCEGTGAVRCQHGILPVPVPATANIMEKFGFNVEIIDAEGEFVTPTGAAAAAALMTGSRLPAPFKIRKTGLGAGKRSYARPSILRAMLIEGGGSGGCIWKLETDIDDCSGEALGYVMEQLFAAGARDVHYHPVFMKKNRPGWQLNVICSEDKVAALEKIIFNETTTIGIRRCSMERTVLPRSIRTVETAYGPANVKVCSLGGLERFYPEYESVAAISRSSGLSYSEVYSIIAEEAARR